MKMSSLSKQRRFCDKWRALRLVIAWVHVITRTHNLFGEVNNFKSLMQAFISCSMVVLCTRSKRRHSTIKIRYPMPKKFENVSLNAIFRRTGSLAMKLAKAVWLFDCGERQAKTSSLIRNGKVDRIFLTNYTFHTNRRPENWTSLPSILTYYLWYLSLGRQAT